MVKGSNYGIYMYEMVEMIIVYSYNALIKMNNKRSIRVKALRIGDGAVVWFLTCTQSSATHIFTEFGISNSSIR